MIHLACIFIDCFFSIHMDQCVAEFDISIMDRMSSIFYSEPVCKRNEFFNRNVLYAKEMSSEKSKAFLDYFTELKIACPMLHARLRYVLIKYVIFYRC